MRTINLQLADALFSKVQQRVLGLLFVNPDRSFYTNEIVRLVDAGVGSVQRELAKLEAVGLAQTYLSGNQKRYQANRDCPIFEELRAIFIKTSGLADVLRQSLANLGDKITLAFIYGSIAKGNDTAASDLDLMLVGKELVYADVFDNLAPCEAQLNRSINPTVYSMVQWQNKLRDGNGFLTTVLSQPKIFLIGSENDIPSLGQPVQDWRPET